MALACTAHNLGLLDVKLALVSTLCCRATGGFVFTSVGRHFLKDPDGFDSICCSVNTAVFH